MSGLLAATGLNALSTTTSIVNVHRGSALAAARVVVVAVPTTAFLVYWWLTSPRRDRGT